MDPPPIPDIRSCLVVMTKLKLTVPLAPRIMEVAAPDKKELKPSSLART